MAEVIVERLAYGGDGVAKLPSGKTVFIPNSCPGDKLRIQITQESQRFDRGKIEYVLEPSPNRVVKKVCKHCDECGGCPWQFLNYDAQLEWKRRFVVDSLQRIGKFENAEEIVAKCIPSPQQWGYRNKIELVPTMEGSKLRLGFHARNSESVIPIEACPLFASGYERVAKSLAGALGYLKANEYGLLRVGVRASKITNSMQVALWTTPDYFPRKAAVDVINSTVSCTSIARVLYKEDAKSRKPVSVETLYGSDTWRERLNGMTMRISAPSFFQVNTLAAEKLVDCAISQLDIREGDAACDLYCGAGTFTLPMAKRTSMVYAIESASSSVRDLRRNLEENELDAEVIGGDAIHESRSIGRVDALLMDPPYSGMGKDIFASVLRLSPEKVALVSCNPSTLARDLVGMREIGYDIRTVTPVDLFPQTYHVETVAILDRSKDQAARIHAIKQRHADREIQEEANRAQEAKRNASKQQHRNGYRDGFKGKSYYGQSESSKHYKRDDSNRPSGQRPKSQGNQGNRQNPKNDGQQFQNRPKRKGSNKYAGKYGRNDRND